jgi:hypothetical protein
MRRTLATGLGGMALALVGAGPASADSIVNVAMLGAGSGRVADTNTRGGIDCPGQCSVDYARAFELRDSLTLSASPGNLSVFKGWAGACSGTEPTCEIAAFYDSTKAVTARIEPLPLFGISGLSVSVAGAGGGTVTGPGVACPGDCSQSYLNSAAVALTATPAAGSTFAGWSGACSGASPSCNLTMSASRSVTATFSADPAQPPGPTPSPGPTGAPGDRGAPGKPGRCTVLGTANADVLTGTPGRDVICGLGGKDTLIGKRGADTLIGGAGPDLLRGGRGRDVLYARDRRKDRLIGGSGSDCARVDTRKDVRRSIESLF